MMKLIKQPRSLVPALLSVLQCLFICSGGEKCSQTPPAVVTYLLNCQELFFGFQVKFSFVNIYPNAALSLFVQSEPEVYCKLLCHAIDYRSSTRGYEVEEFSFLILSY